MKSVVHQRRSGMIEKEEEVYVTHLHRICDRRFQIRCNQKEGKKNGQNLELEWLHRVFFGSRISLSSSTSSSCFLRVLRKPVQELSGKTQGKRQANVRVQSESSNWPMSELCELSMCIIRVTSSFFEGQSICSRRQRKSLFSLKITSTFCSQEEWTGEELRGSFYTGSFFSRTFACVSSLLFVCCWILKHMRCTCKRCRCSIRPFGVDVPACHLHHSHRFPLSLSNLFADPVCSEREE